MSKARLSSDLVVSEARSLLAADGLEALTLRRLGQRLGVDPMAVYRYVANKEALLDAVAGQVLSEATPPSPELPWLERLREGLTSYRSTVVANPFLVALMASRPQAGLFVLDGAEAMLGALREGGLDEEQASQWYAVLQTYVNGSLTLTTVDAQTAIPPELVAGRPHLARFLRAFTTTSAEEQFAFGLDQLLARIEQVAAHPARPGRSARQRTGFRSRV
jgi:TetR/AcrR family transcriptional regulator, tetracycline repressor protein